jgi:hypothetical protein
MSIALSALVKAGKTLFHRGTEAARHMAANAAMNGTPQGATVIPLHPAAAQPEAGPIVRQPAQPPLEVRTLHDDAKLSAFREHDHYGAGYRDGVECPNHEALELGTVRLHSYFDNLLDQMQATRRALIGQAEMRLLDMGQQVSALNEAKLNKFIKQTENELAELQQQRALAQVGKGWYREALANYRAGYLRGMGECADIRSLVG